MSLFSRIRRIIRARTVRKEVAKLRSMTVGDIMTKYVITVKPDDDVIKAATKMIAEDISCLVVTVDDKAVGILSERDFLRKVPLSKEALRMKVKSIMTPNPVTVPRTMKLTEAVALMKAKHFRRLIVAENGKLLGVVTQTDFTKTIARIISSYPVVPELTVGHIMTPQVLTVTPKSSLADLKQKMLKADVGAIIIVDKQKDPTPLGIFTEYDIVMQFYDQYGKLEMKDVSSYMRKYVRATEKDTSIFEANKLMLEKNMRRLLIVDGTKIVGIMTQTDVCRYVYSVLDLIEKSTKNDKAEMRRFSHTPEIHGEFKGEHLKVYTVS